MRRMRLFYGQLIRGDRNSIIADRTNITFDEQVIAFYETLITFDKQIISWRNANTFRWEQNYVDEQSIELVEHSSTLANIK